MQRPPNASDRLVLESLEQRQLLSGGGTDVALIDHTLADYRTLKAAVPAGNKVIAFDGRNDSASKVLRKLAAWAAANGTKIRSISILSHGTAGRFKLGNEWISTQREHEKAWRGLKTVLGEQASIYIFGCNVAREGSTGQLLLDHLATLSGGRVYASTDTTGKGGNWILEAGSAGAVVSPAPRPLKMSALARWAHTLAPGITVAPTSGLTTTEAGGTDTFTVVLDEAPTGDVTIPISSSNTAEGTVSAASLTFTAADWSTPQTVTVTGVDDAVDDGDVAYTIVTGAASSTDVAYDTLDAADVAATNIDNDTAGITVSPTSGLVTTEGGGTDTFTIVLNSQPTANVTIGLSSSDVGEGTVGPASVTFTAANWNVPKTVTVTGVNDFVDDGNIAYSIITAAAVSGDANYSGMNAANVSVTNTDNDTAGITVTPTSGLVTTEAGGTDTFTIVLDSQPTANVSIGLSSSDVGEGTVSPASVTFTAGNWNVAQTVTVTGVNDFVADGNIAYTINTAAAVSGDAKYSGMNPANVSVTNTDNDTAGITVSPTSGLVTTEAGGTDTFTVVLNSQPTANVSIGLSSTDVSEGTVSPASVSFTAGNWNVPQTVTVTGVNDFVDDGNIAYTIATAAAVSADPSYSGMNPANVSVTNTDNDTAGITVSPTSGLTTTEAGGSDTFDVVLNSQPTANVVIPISSSNAGEGTVSTGSLTFTAANWNITQTVTVTGVDDFVDDGNIAYSIITGAAVSGDANYSGMNPSNVSATNTDNDTAGITVSPTSGLTTTEAGGTATFDMVLTSQPTANVTIGLSSSNAGEGTVSPGSVTFTAANWNVTQTVTITGVNDFVDDGNIVYSIVTAAAVSGDANYSGMNPSNVSVTNIDNDTAGITVSPTSGLTTTEAGGTATFTIVLDSQPTANVLIGLSSSDTTEGTVSPGSVTFTAANWNIARTVTVTGVDDFVADGNIAYSIVTAAAVSGDAIYNGMNPANVSVTNNDNDVAGITVSPTSGLTTTEAGGTSTFTVVLNSQPLANVSIGLSSNDVTEGTVGPGSVTFTAANWNVARTITVTGVNDSVDDGDIAYSIITAAAASVDPAYSGMNASDVSLTNTDDDTAGITVSPTSGLTTTEAGGTSTFNVVLNSQPTANVTISIASNDLTEGTVSASSLIFTAANWNVAQTVTVTGVNDAVDDGDIAYSITTGAAVSADANYSGMNPSDVSVTNIDDDTAGITVSPTSGLTTTEAGGTATFNVTLTSQPTANVTIALNSSNTAEGTVSTALLTFTAANWNIAQTVTVTGQDDFVDDGNIAYTVVTAAASSADANYNGLNPSDVSVTNNDDDTAGITVSPTSGLSTTEAGSQTSFDVVLTSQPTANATLGISSNDTTEGTVSTASLTFTAANWNVPQTVIITSVDDAIIDGDITYTINTAAAVSADANYNGINPSNVSVTNHDNDPTGTTSSPEFKVNTTTGNNQQTFPPNARAVASDANGNFIVVWSSLNQDGSGWGVYGQRFDSNAVTIGAEFQINQTTSSDQQYSHVAVDANGDFVVTWSSNTQDGSGWGIYARRYDSTGAALGGEFRVNTTTAGDQQFSDIAMDTSGNFLIVWTGADASGKGVFAQRYNSAGVAQGAEFRANTTTANDQLEPAVGMDYSGNFVIVWSSLSQDGGGYGVYGQRYNAAGVAQGAEFRVNTTTANDQRYPSVAMDSTGDFNVVWSSMHTISGSNYWGVFGQRYNAAGATVGGQFQVNVDTDRNETYASISLDADGDFVVTWSADKGSAGSWAVYAQQYDNAGNKRGGQFLVNTYFTSDQQYSAVSLDPIGDYAIVWTSNGEDGSGQGVYGRLYFGGNNPPANSLPAAQSVNEDAQLTFSSGNGNLISISDPDAGSNSVQVTLASTNGVLTLSGIAGLTFTAGDGTADAAMTFTGSIANINAALAGMKYIPNANYNGPASLSITTDDLGNFGWGTPQSDTDTLNITVNPVNDPPVNSVPAAQITNEDTGLTFSSGNGNQISISDIDAASGAVQVTLTAANGVLTLSGTTGLTFTAGDGTTDATMTFTGTMANINTALDGLLFNPDSNFNGAASVQITTNDQGNTGSGGALGDTDTVNITVNPVNDAPVNNLPAPQSVNEDGNLVLSTVNGNRISVSDVDVAAGTMRVTLTASNGILTLSGTSGLTFTSGDGVADATMTFTGNLANINAALDGLSFAPTPDYNGAASIQIVTDDLGNSGAGGALSDTDTLNITVNPVNDPPINSIPAAQNVNEDAVLTLSSGGGNAISISDIDAAAGSVRVSLTGTNGVISLSGIAGLTFITGDGTADALMTFTGTLAAINTALDGMTFAPALNYNGPASISITTNDQGNSGSGGALSDTDVLNITVDPVNDPPVNSIPGPQSVNEDSTLVFSAGGGNAITVSDLDAGAAVVQVTLTSTNGTLSLGSTTGLTFSTGDGASDVTMTFTGTMAAINAAMNGMSFAPTADYNGPATVQITTDDLGNSGAGGSLTDTDTINITVNPVNDPPVNSVPGPQSVNEDTPLTFSAGGGNAISISDIDAAAGIVRVTLTATNGAVTLSGIAGLTFITGDGTADAVMTFTGTMAAINTALNGMSFLPSPDYNGAASVQITTNDQGNTGSGGALSDTDTVNITVNPVNDAPVNNLPAPQNVNEDAALVLSTATGSAISVTDIDAGGGLLKVTLTAVNGLLSLSGTTGLTFSAGDGAADATMTFTGNLAAINAALNGMSFAPTPDYNGPATIQITTNDQGNSGIGGALSDTDTLNITVDPVNDPPVNSVPGPQVVNEDTTLVLSSAGGNEISISDIDAAAGLLKVTLAATNGALSLSGTTGLTFSVGDGSADATMTFTGTLADINAALDGLSFLGNADYNGPASIQITTDDQGNTGSGGALSDTDVLNITINPVNDAPTVTLSGSPLAYIENSGPIAVDSGLLVKDIDSALLVSAKVQIIGYVSGEDSLSFIDQGGITGSWDSGTGILTLTGDATVSDYQSALQSIAYMNASDNPNTTPRTVRFTVNDGEFDSAPADQTITITPVNDAPVNNLPAPQSTSEDTPLVLASGTGNAISIYDVDVKGGMLQVTLTATHGLLTLGGTSGLTFTTGDGAGDATMTFSGTLVDLNAALDGLTFAPDADYNGAASIQITTDDQGNTGIGGNLSDTDLLAINIGAVNDPPVNIVPPPQSVNEDSPLVFSTANGNLIAVTDIDAASGLLKVTLTSTNGVLSLAGTTGLVFTTGDGTSDSTMTFTGTLVDINAALDGLTFDPFLNYNGPATVQIITDDQGNSGAGGPLSDTDTVNVTVNPINDAPVNVLPGPQSTNEDTDLVLSGANAISVTDVDVAGGTMQVTLTAANGAITLSTTTGLTFTTGDGAGDATMTFNGTLADINAALNGLIFSPTPDFNGVATIQITTDDQGNNGAGGPLVDTDTLNISVNGINDPPIITVPAAQVTAEDTDLIFSAGGGNALTITDIDAASGLLRINLSVSHGTLTLSGTTGLTFIAGDGAGDAAMTFDGTLTDINAALDGMSFTPALNYNGPAALQIAVDDQGNTGTGGNLTDSDTVAITVTAVNDAPVNVLPPTQNTNEDTALVLSSAHGNAISIADVDAFAGIMQVTLSALHGRLTLASIAGLTFISGDGNFDMSMSFTGTAAAINAALDTLVFRPTADYFGLAGIQITTNDLGNSGAGGALSDTGTLDINVNPVNDPPVLTPSIPGLTYTENDGPVIIDAGLGVNDVDNATLSSAVARIANYVAGEDVLSFVDQSGITGSWDSSSGVLTLTGVATLADYQTALASITYANTSDNPNTMPRTISFTANDGVADSAAIDYTISIVSVNDAPTTSGIPPVEVLEDSSPTGISLRKFFADAEDPDDQLVFTVTGNSNAGLFSNVSIDPATGKLALDYAPNAFGSSLLHIRATDTQGKFVETTIDVTVDPVNDAPTVATSGGYAFFTFDGKPLVIDDGIAINDIDNTTLAGAVVRINSYVATEDTLNFAPQHGISGAFDAATGSLTLTGTATLADYRTALRSIEYQNLSTNPHRNPRVIDFAVTDGDAFSVFASRVIAFKQPQSVDPPTVIIQPPSVTPPPVDITPVPPHSRHNPEPPPPTTIPPIPPRFPPGDVPPQKIAVIPAPIPAPRPPAPLPEQPAPPPPPPPVAVIPPIIPPAPPALPIQPLPLPEPKHYQTSNLWKQLDQLSRELNAETKQSPVTAGAVTGLTTTLLSVGYVIWCLRGGSMVATLLTTLPLWRWLDPLPVLDMHGGAGGLRDEKEDEDEKRLRTLME